MPTTRSDAPPAEGARPARPVRPRWRRRLRRVAPWVTVGVLAVAAFVVRLPFLGVPLGADEAGFLTVAEQWGPGSSLYGDLWVDRPPGLILLFEAASPLGAVGVRLLGALAAAGSVLAAAWLTRRTTRHRGAVVASAVLVAALLSGKWLQVGETNGELLALPFLLLGLTALVVAHERAHRGEHGRRVLPVAVVAGACAALAASVKQNLLDVVVVGLLLVGVLVLQRRRRAAGRLLLGAVVGAGAVTVVLLGVAWARGTTPAELWDALVVFRVQAGEVIRLSSTDATQRRAGALLLVMLVTGLPLLALCVPHLCWRPAPDLRRQDRRGVVGDPAWSWLVAALLGFETVSVALGGSYWWHYLIGLVPGAVLLLALAWPVAAAEPRRLVGPVLLVPFVVSMLVSWVALAVDPPRLPPEQQELVDVLRADGSPGGTGLIAFGGPNLLRDAGLRPAYEHLWSLPARVRDSDLGELDAVLEDPQRRPDWVVVSGRGFGTWGVDPAAARRTGELARRHYDVVARLDAFTVLRRSS